MTFDFLFCHMGEPLGAGNHRQDYGAESAPGIGHETYLMHLRAGSTIRAYFTPRRMMLTWEKPPRPW